MIIFGFLIPCFMAILLLAIYEELNSRMDGLMGEIVDCSRLFVFIGLFASYFYVINKLVF